MGYFSLAWKSIYFALFFLPNYIGNPQILLYLLYRVDLNCTVSISNTTLPVLPYWERSGLRGQASRSQASSRCNVKISMLQSTSFPISSTLTPIRAYASQIAIAPITTASLADTHRSVQSLQLSKQYLVSFYHPYCNT